MGGKLRNEKGVGGGEDAKTKNQKKTKKKKNKEKQWARVQKKRREKLRNGRQFSEREVKELS